MSFDTTSAVAVDDEKQVVNTTSFDINSAKDIPQLQEETPSFFPKDKPTLNDEGQATATNPATDITKFFHNILNRSFEDVKADRDYVKNNLPTPLPNEDVMHFAERVKPQISDKEAQNIRQGTMAQFDRPIKAGLVAGAIIDPIGTATMVGGFALKDQFLNIRKIIDKYAPDTPTDIKDGAEIIDNLATGGVLAHGIGVARPMLNAFLNDRGLPDATTLSPDVLKGLNDFDAHGVGELSKEPLVTERPTPFVKTSQEGWPAQDIETPTGVMSGGTLEKLGITQEHFDASISSDMPVKVPLTKVLDLAQDPKWNDIKQIMTFEGEGGALQQGEENATQGRESTESGSGQEGVKGQAEDGVHLRNTPQGGLETKTGEVETPSKTSEESLSKPQGETIEPKADKGTSKIAKSIEQKAIEDKLTTGFKDLAGYEKINVKEQADLATKTVSNLDDARAMIRGEKPLPEGLRGVSLITAMEAHLKANPDADVAHELANSPLVSETSKAAQELRLAAERTPDSATQKLAEIKQAKLEKAGGEEKVTKTKQDIVKKAQKEMNKINLSKEELSWDRFIKDIAC